MTPQKEVGITPASVTFRRLYNHLNKQMQSVVYVEKCRDQNVPRPKRPEQKGPDQNGSYRNGSDRNGQTESGRPKSPVPFSDYGYFNISPSIS